MRSIGTFWGVGEGTLKALVESQFRRRLNGARPEGSTSMPGDEIISETDQVFDSSVQIDAPPRLVWPWLAQMYRGAGVYGPAALESKRWRSADYLIPDIACPRPGDRLDDILQVASVVPEQEIVWESVAPVAVLGFTIPRLSLCYKLEETPAGGTLLSARLRGTCPGITGQVGDYIFGILDFLLPSCQLLRIKTLAERAARAGQAAPGRGNGVPPPHQLLPFVPARPSNSHALAV